MDIGVYIPSNCSTKKKIAFTNDLLSYTPNFWLSDSDNVYSNVFHASKNILSSIPDIKLSIMSFSSLRSLDTIIQGLHLLLYESSVPFRFIIGLGDIKLRKKKKSSLENLKSYLFRSREFLDENTKIIKKRYALGTAGIGTNLLRTGSLISDFLFLNGTNIHDIQRAEKLKMEISRRISLELSSLIEISDEETISKFTATNMINILTQIPQNNLLSYNFNDQFLSKIQNLRIYNWRTELKFLTEIVNDFMIFGSMDYCLERLSIIKKQNISKLALYYNEYDKIKELLEFYYSK